MAEVAQHSADEAVKAGDVLWTPSAERIAGANVTAFQDWLQRERGLRFDDYTALWRWSVQDLEAFWQALWDYFQIEATALHSRVLDKRTMPGAQWFVGARLNYARHVLREESGGGDALLYASEGQTVRAVSWDTLANRVRMLATRMREMGIQPGDRVAAVLPNIPETVIALLATSAIGAIWSVCSPDFGVRGILDRLAALRPKLLIGIDGYRYGGKEFDRRREMDEVIGGLTDLRHVILLQYLRPESPAPPGGGSAPCLERDFRAPASERGGIQIRGGAIRSPAVDTVLIRYHRTAE